MPKSYQWIENKLLQTAIPDHRKYTVELLLAPHIINKRHLSVGHTYSIIKGWILKCNALTRLEPSLEYFDNKIKTAVNNSSCIFLLIGDYLSYQILRCIDDIVCHLV